MLLSMTGFGKASLTSENKKISFEIKTLNCKQIDISLKYPLTYKEKELDIRNLLINSVIRGKIEATLAVDDLLPKSKSEVNTSVLEDYYKKIHQAAEKIGIPEPKNWLELLLSLPDVLVAENAQMPENEYLDVVKTIENAVSEMTEFRKREGKVLEKFFREKIENINQLLLKVPDYEEERLEKIKSRMSENFAFIGNKIDFDKNRFEQEMIFYIEKFDISEEKLRLKTHLDYFLQTINNEENQGKKLGFITQEMGREINTLGSKSNHSELQKIVVMMKDELEQIKEQVLNVL
ncbi:MAG: YicC family protein [Prevotellaceae bacterium]|jgi:uncharacterized protein (TIGR00255 family)|nr:YicC family protein [Prevotellaceae bacterium]